MNKETTNVKDARLRV